MAPVYWNHYHRGRLRQALLGLGASRMSPGTLAIMGFLDGFRRGRSPRPSQREASDTVRKIRRALEEFPEERATYIAAFAFLLGRVANADSNISDEEVAEMERIVERMGGLPEEQAVLIVQIAKSQHTLFGGTENFIVAQEFNRLANRTQKQALLHCLFAVSSSDQSISVMEDNEIRAITKEIRLDHSDFIAARSAYREHLNVLKG